MEINNKLDKSFGPIGTISGVTMFAVGIILSFFSLSGIFLIVIGSFVGFSSTSTVIDYDKRRVRFNNNLFGIIKIGKWLDIEPSMKIGLRQSRRTWRAHSRGSRSVDITDKDYRIILFDSNCKQIMHLMKSASTDSAKAELELLSSQFGLKEC
ncbi:MAG TPA: hypothetical protein DIW31_06575 [Bacteroidales bacterium]|nr:hypothetical protein [Bacteroidales bacterium]